MKTISNVKLTYTKIIIRSEPRLSDHESQVFCTGDEEQFVPETEGGTFIYFFVFTIN